MHHTSSYLVKRSNQDPYYRLLCEYWCFYVVCGQEQCSLGSIVEPQSGWTPGLWARVAPNQQLLPGVTDSAQPALLWPVCQLLQWAAEDWTCCPTGTLHVSLSLLPQKSFTLSLRGKTELKIALAADTESFSMLEQSKSPLDTDLVILLILCLLFQLVTVSFFYFPLLFFNSMQDISILFNLIIILLMLFNTYVFQIGLVAILLERFRALLMLSALYLTFSIVLHSWLMVRAALTLKGWDLLRSWFIWFHFAYF